MQTTHTRRDAKVASDTESFESFFLASYERIARAVYILVGSASEAEEISQETLVRTLERWDRVKTMDSREGYAMTIAFNLAKRHQRKRRLSSRFLRHPAHRGSSTSDIDASEDLSRALGALPRMHREALVLMTVNGLSAREAGEVLGRPESTVRVHAMRAREALRERLGGEDGYR